MRPEKTTVDGEILAAANEKKVFDGSDDDSNHRVVVAESEPHSTDACRSNGADYFGEARKFLILDSQCSVDVANDC